MVVIVGLGKRAATDGDDYVVAGVDVDRSSVVCECRGDATADDRWWLLVVVVVDGLGRR